MGFERGKSARQSSFALPNFRHGARLADSTTPTTRPSGNERYIRTTNTLIGCTVPPRLSRRQIKRLAVTDWERIANSNKKCSNELRKLGTSHGSVIASCLHRRAKTAHGPRTGHAIVGWIKCSGSTITKKTANDVRQGGSAALDPLFEFRFIESSTLRFGINFANQSRLSRNHCVRDCFVAAILSMNPNPRG